MQFARQKHGFRAVLLELPVAENEVAKAQNLVPVVGVEADEFVVFQGRAGVEALGVGHVVLDEIDLHVEMLRQLYSLGHRRILLFEGSYHSHYLENILRQAARLYPDAVVETTMAEGMADKARLKDDLRSAVARGVTGVCCPGIREAEHLLSCCAEAGIPVPGLSVLSVEHRQDEGASFLPPISAMYVPARQMGRQAAEQLVGALQNEETAPQVEFKAVFVPRATVGPARVETV